jgi:hypothetical protein
MATPAERVAQFVQQQVDTIACATRTWVVW